MLGLIGKVLRKPKLMISSMRQIIRIAAWFCPFLLAFLSLAPRGILVRTGASGLLEHAGSYFVTGLLLAITYPQKRLQIAAWLIAYGGILEMLQNLAPGRSPNAYDACAGSMGAILGVAAPLLIAAPGRDLCKFD
jgi:VanZ family protein